MGLASSAIPLRWVIVASALLMSSVVALSCRVRINA